MKDQTYTQVKPWQMMWLLCGVRGIGQAVRLAWIPLMVYISRDMELTLVSQGHVLSAYSLGYLLTQVPGGYAADRYGCKVVLTLSLVVQAIGMLLAPSVAQMGFHAMYLLYFVIGLFSGPLHPACNSMTTAWFSQSQLGRSSTIIEMGAVAGNFLALLVSTQIAYALGWPIAFLAFAAATAAFLVLWLRFASNAPGEFRPQDANDPVVLNAQSPKLCPTQTDPKAVPSTERPERNAQSRTQSPKPKARDPKNPEPCPAQCEPGGPVSVGASGSPLPMIPKQCLLSSAVWCIVIQHSLFNATKYCLASGMPMYFNQAFSMEPHQVGILLSFPEAAGVIVPFAVTRLEKHYIRLCGSGDALQKSRCFFGCCGFGLICLPLAIMAWGYSALGPSITTGLLCCCSGCLVLHSLGFKANYMDITYLYQGIFLGIGNTIASFVTFVVPILLAHALETFNGNWSVVFYSMVLINIAGFIVSLTLTSARRIDDDIIQAS